MIKLSSGPALPAGRLRRLRSRLWDARSGRVVFVSHCLLNQNTRYLGGAFRPGAVHEVLDPFMQGGIGICQMPRPEQLAWGGGDAAPTWWPNLQAHPDVRVDLAGGSRQVTGRAAHSGERERLWTRWWQINKNDAYAARRSRHTAVVVLEPRHQSPEDRHARPDC